MSDCGSGVLRCFAATSERIEAFARLAYTVAGCSPRRPPGPGILLQRIVGPSALRSVEVGVAPRDARLAFRPGDANPPCEWVMLSARQNIEDLTIACARACACIVQWLRHERWNEPTLFAVTLAIAMPEPAIRHQIGHYPVESFADAYVVPYEYARDRLAMFRSASDSGEWFAVTDTKQAHRP